jgi:hypothetical protein
MPKREYDFGYDEPVSIDVDPETALRTLLNPDPAHDQSEEDQE